MAEPFYTCCEDGMLSQVPPTDGSGLCPACKPSVPMRRLTDEELTERLRAPGTLTWGQCRNMVEALRAQGVIAYAPGTPAGCHYPACQCDPSETGCPRNAGVPEVGGPVFSPHTPMDSREGGKRYL